MTGLRGLAAAAAGAGLVLLLGGCPTNQPLEFITGGTGNQSQLGTQASVRVLSPTADLAITGGTPVEVNWNVVATTNFASVDVIFDPDDDPNNGNEIIGVSGLGISDSNTVLDTTPLDAGTYFIGVVLRQQNQIAAFDYADGRVIVNQQARFFFTAPRNNFVFDRSPLITPQFNVAWEVHDPDSTVTVQIFLDPDDVPNGNEILLRESNDQNGDSFQFNLPTASFEPGTYRLLAVVSDGTSTAEFYAPASIRLRSRLAGIVDLRDLGIPEGGISGAIFEGVNPRDNLGSFVGAARDADGDGFDDFIMLAQFAKPRYGTNNQRTGPGEAYLVYGRQQRFSGVININSAGTLFRADVYTGPAEAPDPIRPSRGITSFAVISDWDGDGVREFAFGIPFVDSQGLTTLDANGYFRSGAVVIAAGSTLRPDLGFPGAGPARVIRLSTIGTLPHEPFVDASTFNCTYSFTTPKAPSAAGSGATLFNRYRFEPSGNGGFRLGCRISTIDTEDMCGETVSAYQFDSLIISVPNRDPRTNTTDNFTAGRSIPGAGVVSVFYCRTDDGFYPWGATNSPPATDTYPGTPESDGVVANDLPHGGPYHYVMDDLRSFSGFRASPGYTLSTDDALPCVQVSDSRAAGRNTTTRLWTGVPGAHLGGAVGIGDVNNDGLEDILVGSPQAEDGAGACFIVFGRFRTLVVGADFNLDEIGLPINGADGQQTRIFDGIRIVGEPGSRLGQSQDSAGDFNGDGVPDVVIGSPLLNNRKGGVAVFFGSRNVVNLTQAEIALDSLPSRGLGIIIEGEDEGDLAGARVAGVGDVDGDGLDDIMIAAPDRSVHLDIDLDGNLEIDREHCGVVYLVYGSAKLEGTLKLADIGTEKLPGAVFVGRNSDEHLGAGLGEQGDRSHGMAKAGDVDGDGHMDLLLSSVKASPRDRTRAGEVYLIYGQGD